MKQLLAWLLTAILFAGLGGLCVWAFERAREHGEHEPEEKTAEPTTQEAAAHDEAGNVILTIDEETQHRVGIEVKPLAEATHQPEVVAFGTLEQDPSRSFIVRSPLAGVLRADESRSWPTLGEVLADGTVIGRVQPRLGPAERADLQSKLAVAQGDVEELEASVAAQRISYESKRKLNADKIVADQVLQEAEAKLKGEEARLQAARQTVRALERSMVATTQPVSSFPLVVELGGQTVDIPARPGESVESGQEILRVARFDRMVARVCCLAGGKVAQNASTARLVVIGHEDHPLAAKRIAAAASTDPLTGGQTLLFEIESEKLPLQPGMSLTAYLPLPGEPAKGVLIPRSAVIRFAGESYVYVQSGPDKFTRRPVTRAEHDPQGLFVAEGFKPGEPVVVRGAQMMLSQELKFGTQEKEE